MEVLDATRIHPETYEWARKIAVDAIADDSNGNDDDDVDPTNALEEILNCPGKLELLDLQAFAEVLLDQARIIGLS